MHPKLGTPFRAAPDALARPCAADRLTGQPSPPQLAALPVPAACTSCERSEQPAAGRPGSASPGLVNTVSSHTFQPPGCPSSLVAAVHAEWKGWQWISEENGGVLATFNAWWATKMRLAKMRRRTLTRSRVQSQEISSLWADPVCDFITLTYRPGDEWSPRHVAKLVNCYREQARRDGVEFRYEWCAELQLKRMRRTGESAREVMHYHILMWHPSNYSYPFPDQRGWWPFGMTNVEQARNPVGYLAKYASKGTEGESLPRGARVSGGGGLSELGRREVSWWMLPRYVREAFPTIGAKVRREVGGGWLNWDEGVFLDAPKTW
jgi:hypothetical protein